MAEGSFSHTAELLAMIHNTALGREAGDLKTAAEFNSYAPPPPQSQPIEIPIQALKVFTKLPLR